MEYRPLTLIPRRHFLKLLGLTPFLAHCAAPTPAATTKKKIWLDMDQAELDAAYTQSVWAPNAQDILQRYKSRSEAVRSWLKLAKRYSYGASAVEGLDLFQAETNPAPIHIFIHGGAWAGGAAKDYSFVAEHFVRAGAHVVIPDFASVNDVGGNLEVLVDQVRTCVEWVYVHAHEFGGDPYRIFISGHSSGAHLAAAALTTDWPERGLPFNLLKGGLLCSGMYDLEPVRLSARSKYIKFTDAMEESLSPQRLLRLIRSPLIVGWGTKESPEFQRQGREFVAALKKVNKPVLSLTRDLNHFEILFDLADANGRLAREMLKQMGLA